MFTTLSLSAMLNLADPMLEKGRGLLLASKQAPRKMWEGHNKRCRLKGNGSIWRVGMVLC
jgi:hypothetical protein